MNKKDDELRKNLDEERALQMTIRLSARDAKKLMNAFLHGRLSQFKVTSISVSAPTPSVIPGEEISSDAVEFSDAEQQATDGKPAFAKRVGKQQRKKARGHE